MCLSHDPKRLPSDKHENTGTISWSEKTTLLGVAPLISQPSLSVVNKLFIYNPWHKACHRSRDTILQAFSLRFSHTASDKNNWRCRRPGNKAMSIIVLCVTWTQCSMWAGNGNSSHIRSHSYLKDAGVQYLCFQHPLYIRSCDSWTAKLIAINLVQVAFKSIPRHEHWGFTYSRASPIPFRSADRFQYRHPEEGSET